MYNVDKKVDTSFCLFLFDYYKETYVFLIDIIAICTCSISMLLVSNSYTMGCPPVRGDNPRALASGLSYVQVDKHGIAILYHLHQCRPCTSRDISCLSW